MSARTLSRRMALETRADQPDGAGGIVQVWTRRGEIWCALRPRAVREGDAAGRAALRQRWQVHVHAVPGELPVPGARLRDDALVLRVLSVAVDGRDPGRAICVAEEEIT